MHEHLHHVIELERCHVVLIWRHNVGVYRITPFTHDNLRHGTYWITFSSDFALICCIGALCGSVNETPNTKCNPIRKQSGIG